jgi:glyoxalase family protein
MENKILGIHHITAIAGNAKRNFDFYTRILGLRLVKKTVNFDDPGTYHLYYGDEAGSPGTILTFFPWEGVQPGKQGTGMATDIAYSVPAGSLDFWKKRLQDNQVSITGSGERLGEEYISFTDPDGLPLTFTIAKQKDNRKAWETPEVKADTGTQGFHAITLSLNDIKRTASILTDIFGYTLTGQEQSRHRYQTDAVQGAAIIDLLELPAGHRAVNASGTIHHIAFRVRDEKTLMAFREKIVGAGYDITPKIDRNYFFSLYFREPGGVLFELATDNPGFAVDEPATELGTTLKLPPQYEAHRKEIEAVLPALD